MTALPQDVCVVGAGGIGCAVGHALLAGGADPTFVEVDDEKIRWGSEHGISVDGLSSGPARFERFEDWRPPDEALILLTTKSFDNAAVLEKLPRSVDVIPIQNGFDRRLVDRCAVEGIASFVSKCSPGKTQTRITRPGSLHLGHSKAGQDGPSREVIEMLGRILSAHGRFDLEIVDEILPYKYTKLMFNAAISPLAALAGVDNSALLTNAKARRLFFRLLRENYEILRSANIELKKIGPFEPLTVHRILKLPLIARLLAWPCSLSLKGTYCSMAGDIERGRTEIDCYNGHLLELANGRSFDLNRRIYDLVTRLAQQKAAPGLQYLDELLAASS